MIYKSIPHFVSLYKQGKTEIVFLHKIIEGSASRSYGIHVAKLAGIPSTILDRAREKLSELETGQITVKNSVRENNYLEEQISFFSVQPDSFKPDPLAEKLKSLNLMEITPSQAIKILEELKESLDD